MTTQAMNTSPYGANRAQRRAAAASGKQRLTKPKFRLDRKRGRTAARKERGYQKLALWFGF